MDPLQTAAAVGSGVIVGFTLGLVGGGGSILAVPLLLYVVGMPDPHLAIGTSAVAVAVNAFANLVSHAREQHVRWHPALVFAAAGLAGAFAGSSIGKAVDGRRLLILFALLMLFVAAMMLRGRRAPSGPVNAERRVNLCRLGPIGLGVGSLSGFYGIGGGFLVVPGLILGTGMPTGRAGRSIGLHAAAITSEKTGMEEQVNILNANTADGAPRRNFFRLAGATMLGLAGLASAVPRAWAATPLAGDGPTWPGKLKGRHRQVVDAYSVNGGYPLVFASTFLLTDPAPGSATSVVILRSQGLVVAVNNTVWEKYKIGESLKIIDPETKAPAVKNPFVNPEPGVLLTDDSAVDRLLGKGAVFGACNVALHGLSKRLANNADVSADDAAKEWAANLVPGITLLPSGVWGLNRAQEAGCTYCTGG